MYTVLWHHVYLIAMVQCYEMTSFHKVNSLVVNYRVVYSHVVNLSRDQLYISEAVPSVTFCPIRECSDDCLLCPGPMETRASITEFIAEDISIHDPNAQEVNPQALRLRDCL